MITQDGLIYSNIAFDHKPNDTEVRILASQALTRVANQLRVREGASFVGGTTTITVSEVEPGLWHLLTLWAPLDEEEPAE